MRLRVVPHAAVGRRIFRDALTFRVVIDTSASARIRRRYALFRDVIPSSSNRAWRLMRHLPMFGWDIGRAVTGASRCSNCSTALKPPVRAIHESPAHGNQSNPYIDGPKRVGQTPTHAGTSRIELSRLISAAKLRRKPVGNLERKLHQTPHAECPRIRLVVVSALPSHISVNR